MKKLLVIALIISSLTGFSQSYTIRDIVLHDSGNDTFCVKVGSPDTIWKKTWPTYTFYYKSSNRRYLPFSNVVGTPTSLAGYGILDAASSSHTHAYSEITDKPSLFDAAYNSLTGKPDLTVYKLKTDTGRVGGNAVTGASLKSVIDSIAANIALKANASAVSNVTNTSDANKPVSTAQQTALDLKQNISTAKGYALSVQALTSSPADGQTIYFGALPKAPVTAAATSKIYIRKAGTIKIAEIYCYSGTAGTNEAWAISIRLNNTTDTQIASLSVNTSERVWSNAGLGIAVSVGDYIEIKSVNPTWATNPLTTIFGGYIYIE